MTRTEPPHYEPREVFLVPEVQEYYRIVVLWEVCSQKTSRPKAIQDASWAVN